MSHTWECVNCRPEVQVIALHEDIFNHLSSPVIRWSARIIISRRYREPAAARQRSVSTSKNYIQEVDAVLLLPELLARGFAVISRTPHEQSAVIEGHNRLVGGVLSSKMRGFNPLKAVSHQILSDGEELTTCQFLAMPFGD
jgi:hypothetical protein